MTRLGAAVSPRAMVRAALICALCGAGRLSHAGVIRHDRDDAAYRALANQPDYAAVGQVRVDASGASRLCTGTMIAPDWVLTAAHCLAGGTADGSYYRNLGESLFADEFIVHPQFTGNPTEGNDIGLMHLAAPSATFTPAQRMRNQIPLGRTATILGFGQTGTGLTGSVAGTHGTKRAGQNVVDVNGTRVVGSNNRLYPDYMLFTDFDNPDNPADSEWGSAAPLDLEYQTAPGDSGGGWFADDNGHQRLYAVHSIGLSFDESQNNDYGDAAGATRVSRFNSWIDEQLGAVYWMKPAGGAYDNPENWSNLAAAPTDQPLRFAFPNAYTVDVAAEQQIGNLLVDRGDVTFAITGGPLHISGGNVASGANARFDASPQSTLEIAGPILGDGAITKSGGGVLQFAGNASVSNPLTVSGGSIVAAPASQVTLSQLTLNANEPINMQLGQQSALTLSTSLVIAGTTTVDVADAATLHLPALTQDGQLAVHGGAVLVDGALTESLGAVTAISLDPVLFDGADVPLQLGAGSALAGILQLDLEGVPAFDPRAQYIAKQEWTLISSTSDLTGAFTNVEWLSKPDGFDFSVVYDDNAVKLEIDRIPPAFTYLDGDTNGDRKVDLLDLNNVRTNFGASRGLGDTNDDGQIDLLDLNEVRNHFGAGVSDRSQAVPEPGSWALACAALIALSAFRCSALK